MMSPDIKKLFIVLAFIAVTHTLHAGSATWNLNPTSSDWNTPENWTPATVPNTEADTATFGPSNTTNLAVGEWSDGSGETVTNVGDIVFAEGASAYTITITPVFDIVFPSIIEIYGGGIMNSSGVVQNFVAANSGTTKGSARIYFNNSASAGENVVITNEGGASATGDGTYGGFTSLEDTSTAANAIFVNNGGTVSGTVYGGFTDLLFYSSAEGATFINNPGTVSGAAAGHTLVQSFPPGTIGPSTFIANPATVSGAEGGWVEIDVGTLNGTNFIANGAAVANAQAGQIYVYGAAYNSGDGIATFTGNGGRGSGAEGGLIDLFALPRSDQTIVSAKGGRNGGLGGHIVIEGDPVLDLGQFQLFGNAVLDLTNVMSRGITIGSLAGNGAVFLAGHSLSVGNNNLNTTFSGVLQDAGSVIKVGAGTLTLGGASTYTGGTTVSGGTLRVTNQSGSVTGTGSVWIKAGTLGGKGTIAGAVTIGTGSGTGAVLAPSVGAGQLATLTLQKTLAFKADGTYTYKLNTNNARADQVIARGVSIESGAQFDFQAVGNRKLAMGTVFTALSNTSANPISGTFSNLAEGTTITAGRNKFRVSYSGGDGNDLTLTVVP